MLFDFIKAIVLAGIPIAAFSYYLIILTTKKIQLQSTNATQLKKELKKIELVESIEKETFIQSVLQKKFMKFGGGFYGVLTFITYLHIEGYQVIQFISSFTADGTGLNSGIFSLILGFFLDMIINFFTALMWPIYWFKFLPIESFWIWLLVSISAHTWAARYALSRKGSNI